MNHLSTSMRSTLTVALALSLSSAASADIPRSGLELFAGTSVDVAAIERAAEVELAIPDEWIARAAEEGPILFNSPEEPDITERYLAVFRERYPDIQIEVINAVGAARAVRPLLAYEMGTLIADVVVGFGSNITDYNAADALQEIDDLPAFNSVPEDKRDDQGRWAGFSLINWCLAYSTERVSPEDLPETWFDLVAADGPLADGRVGVANRAHLWLVSLWGQWGADRVRTEFLPAFFNDLNPQLRREGLAGILRLISIGEFDVALPAAESDVKLEIEMGARLGFHCMDLVPQYFTEIGMFRESPREYSAKILINWILSQEGQAARYVTTNTVPVNKDMQGPQYLSFPDQILSNTVALRTIPMLVEELPNVYEVWNPAWQASGGPAEE